MCCKTIVEDKAGNIKDLVVALPSYLINTKVFPFPIFDMFLISVKYYEIS